MNFVLLLRTAILIVSLLHTIDAANRYYDCRRQNSQCASHPYDCNLATGVCECSGDRDGFDCGLLQSQIITEGCTVTCEFGTCYQPTADPAVHGCYCQEPYYGEFCTLDRVAILTCDGLPYNMRLNVNPYRVDAFDGIVTVSGASLAADSGCLFVNSERFNEADGTLRQKGYYVYASSDSDCTYVESEENPNTFIYPVFVYYDQNIRFWNDVLFLFACNLVDPTALISGLLGVSGDLSILDSGTVGVTGGVTPVLLEIINTLDGTLVSNVVAIGDDVSMRFTLENVEDIYVDYLVDSCIITDLDPAVFPAAERQITQIISGRCPTEIAYNEIFTTAPTIDGTVVTFPLSVFKYTTSNTLYFQCELTYCTQETLAECLASVTCDINFPAFGRKKRAETPVLGLNRTESPNKVTRARLFVVNKNSIHVPTPNTTDTFTVTPCFKSLGFILFIASTGLLILIAVTIAIAVCVRYNLKQKSPEKIIHFTR